MRARSQAPGVRVAVPHGTVVAPPSPLPARPPGETAPAERDQALPATFEAYEDEVAHVRRWAAENSAWLSEVRGAVVDAELRLVAVPRQGEAAPEHLAALAQLRAAWPFVGDLPLIAGLQAAPGGDMEHVRLWASTDQDASAATRRQDGAPVPKPRPFRELVLADSHDLPFPVDLSPHPRVLRVNPGQVHGAALESVDLNRLIATQPSLTVTRILPIGTPTTHPIVVEADGQRYIYDGHKRLSRAKRGGAAKALARVIRMAMAEWDESLHPRDHGKFTASGGGGTTTPRPSASSIPGTLAELEEYQERINDQSMLAETPEQSEAFGRKFAAADAIATVLRNQQMADADPELAKTSLFLYARDQRSPGEVAAAVHAQLHGDKMELKWAGSLVKGAGEKLVRQAMDWGRAHGATGMTGTAKWNSIRYYESRFGASRVPGTENPINDSVEFKVALADHVDMADWDESQHPRGEHGKFGQGGRAQEPSDQEKSHIEWKANADRVAQNPAAASAKDLNRAAGYLSHKREALLRDARKEGREANRHLLESIAREIEWYTELQTQKRGLSDGQHALADPPHQDPADAVDHLEASAELAVQTAADRMVSQATAEALRLERAGWDAAEIEDALRIFLGDLSEADLERIANEEVNEAFSLGRHAAATENRENIESATYSAIMDKDTCDRCEEEDGKEFEVDSPEYEEVLPPNPACAGWDQCRCVFIYVLREGAEDVADGGAE